MKIISFGMDRVLCTLNAERWTAYFAVVLFLWYNFFLSLASTLDLFHFCLGISIQLQFYVEWLNVTLVSNKPHFGKYLYVFFRYFVYFPFFFSKWSLNVTTRLLFFFIFRKSFGIQNAPKNALKDITVYNKNLMQNSIPGPRWSVDFNVIDPVFTFFTAYSMHSIQSNIQNMKNRNNPCSWNDALTRQLIHLT